VNYTNLYPVEKWVNGYGEIASLSCHPKKLVKVSVIRGQKPKT